METQQYELRHKETGEVRDTRSMTSEEATEDNYLYSLEGEPWRWVPKPKRNGQIIQPQQRVHIEEDGNLLWAI